MPTSICFKIKFPSITRALAFAILAIAAVGCATPPAPINYAPSSILSATGAVKVEEFRYLPAEETAASTAATDGKQAKTSNDTKKPADRPRQRVAKNQIRNTAIGNIFIDRDVKTLIRDAVFAELRFVGVKTDSSKVFLRGNVEEFLIDDLGYSVDWTLRVRYELVDAATQKTIYEDVKNIQRNTAKFVNVFGALNETIKLNIEELIKDKNFLDKIQ